MEGIVLIVALIYWVIGAIGICRTDTMKTRYGSIISGYWGVLRMVQHMGIILGIICIIGNYQLVQEAKVMGYTLIFHKSDIFWYLLIIGLTILFFVYDRKRFYQRCDRKLARKLKRNELMLGCSVLTRLSLFIFKVGMTAAFVMTDTSEYYIDKRDGKIYRETDGL